MEFPELEGKTAVVTGGTSGIGRAVSLALADAGANVVPVSRTESRVEEVTEEVGSDVVRATDVRAKDDVQELFEQVHSTYGPIDVLVNSAGIFFDESPITELDEETWNDIIQTNLYGTFVTTQLFPAFSGEGDSAIVNVSSIAGQLPLPDLTTYTISKFGVNGLTKSFALKYADIPVRVNAVAPGYAKTAQNRENLEDPEVKEDLLGKTPLGRYAQLDEIANAVLFLASPSVQFVTGEILTVDGGFSLRH